MDRFSDKLEVAREARNRLIRSRDTSDDFLDDDDFLDENTLARLIELGMRAHEWEIETPLLEFDPIDLTIIEKDKGGYKLYSSLAGDLGYLLSQIRTMRNGSLSAGDVIYSRTGTENEKESDDTVLVGKLGGGFCIVSDESKKVVLSPPFDTLLYVSSDFIDVQLGNQRLRLDKGTYESPSNRSESPRLNRLNDSLDVPTALDYTTSTRISILKPTLDAIAVIDDEAPEEAHVEIYPHEEAALSFQAIQSTVVEHIKKQPPTRQVVDALRETDKALHLPAVAIDSQQYTLSLRTSDNADVLFFHNTTSRSAQDQVADAMFAMTTDEFLELALDDARRERFLVDTLAETGFYFVRQHDGKIFLMDRNALEVSMITPDSPYFMDILHKAEEKLAEYFSALETQSPNSIPLRATRLILADDIEQTLPKRERIPQTKWQKALHWLLHQ